MLWQPYVSTLTEGKESTAQQLICKLVYGPGRVDYAQFQNASAMGWADRSLLGACLQRPEKSGFGFLSFVLSTGLRWVEAALSIRDTV